MFCTPQVCGLWIFTASLEGRNGNFFFKLFIFLIIFLTDEETRYQVVWASKSNAEIKTGTVLQGSFHYTMGFLIPIWRKGVLGKYNSLPSCLSGFSSPIYPTSHSNQILLFRPNEKLSITKPLICLGPFCQVTLGQSLHYYSKLLCTFLLHLYWAIGPYYV